LCQTAGFYLCFDLDFHPLGYHQAQVTTHECPPLSHANVIRVASPTNLTCHTMQFNGLYALIHYLPGSDRLRAHPVWRLVPESNSVGVRFNRARCSNPNPIVGRGRRQTVARLSNVGRGVA